MAECCDNCKHFYKRTAECHAEPPQAQMFQVPRPSIVPGKMAIDTNIQSYWPPLNPALVKELVCGKYKARLDK